MQNRKLCTIVTDASFCDKTKAAGWAVWIVCDEGRYKHFGGFKTKIDKPHEAEIKAILNGLYFAKKQFVVSQYHIVTDCQAAIDHLKNTLEWQAQVKNIIGNGIVTFSHVKAHTKKEDKRSYVNRWCDKQAKVYMQKQREQFLN